MSRQGLRHHILCEGGRYRGATTFWRHGTNTIVYDARVGVADWTRGEGSTRQIGKGTIIIYYARVEDIGGQRPFGQTDMPRPIKLRAL